MRTKKTIRRQQGFTLIEVIVVLVLVGIMAAMAGFGMITGVQGYLMASENANVTQKAQLAMTRLTRELIQCMNCDDGNVYPDPFNSFTYEVSELGNRELVFEANQLQLGIPGETNVLVDQVVDFSLIRDNDRRLTLILVMDHQQGGGNLTFETSIFPRNTYF